MYYQRNAFGILRYRERPWCVAVKESYLGQTSDWTTKSDWKPTNSSALCAELPGTSKAPKRVVHFIFLSPPVPSRLRNPSTVATVHWLTKASWKRAAPCKKTNFESSLPLRSTYENRLQLTNLLPISYWHEFLDIVFFYKAVNNLVFIDSEALPATRQSTRSTRSSSSNAITYIPKRSRTVTYQRSFFIRACRTWNVLPAELRTSHISLASFKRSLLQCYNKALDLYDVDDIRTWRTICPRCNIARTLLCPPTGCF